MPLPTTADFRSTLHGRLITPDDAAYDSGRRVFNAMIDRRPALIAQCRDADDVVASVAFARDHAMPLSVRGGGHSVAGRAVCDEGLMIDLSTMKGVRIDPQARIAHAEPGMTLGEFDRATAEFGLATPLGIVSVTGISGLTLGGGIGWLNGRYGLACDNVISFEIVTADARRLTVNDAVNDDLFWALRGGSGNFGVVTSIEYRLHPVSAMLAGPVFHGIDRAREALAFFLEFSANAPDELSTMAGLVTLPDGTPAAALAVCYCGSVAEGERVVAPLRAFGSPIADLVQPMPYTGVQSMLDGFFPPGRHHYWKSSLTSRVSDAGVDFLVDTMRRKPSPFTIAALQQLHGAAARVAPQDTAFAHRGNRFDCAVLTQWSDPADTDVNVAWARELWAGVEPHVDRAVYVNNLGEEPDTVVRAAYGNNYARLASVKAKYDPANVFRSTQNVTPQATATATAP
jgi:FAD/FMN-containing dehydrogenase